MDQKWLYGGGRIELEVEDRINLYLGNRQMRCGRFFFFNKGKQVIKT